MLRSIIQTMYILQVGSEVSKTVQVFGLQTVRAANGAAQPFQSVRTVSNSNVGLILWAFHETILTNFNKFKLFCMWPVCAPVSVL